MTVKRSLVLIIGMFILLGFLNSKSQEDSSQPQKSPEEFFSNLKTLAESEIKDAQTEKLFEDIIGNPKQLTEIIEKSPKRHTNAIEEEWNKRKEDVGLYIGKILIKNLGEPGKLKKVQQFLIELKTDLKSANYYTAGQGIYDSMIDVIRTDSSEEFRKFLNGSGLVGSTTNQQTFDGFERIDKTVSVYHTQMEQRAIIKDEIKKQLLKDENLDNQIETKLNNKLRKIEKLLYRDFFRIGVLLLFMVIALNIIMIFLLLRPRKIFKQMNDFESKFSNLEKFLKGEINRLNNKKIYTNEIILTNRMKEEISMDVQNESSANFDKFEEMFPMYRKHVGRRLKSIEEELGRMKQEGVTHKEIVGLKSFEQRIGNIEDRLAAIEDLLRDDKSGQSIMQLIDAIPGKITKETAETERGILKEIWNWEIFKSIRGQLSVLSEGVKDNNFFDLCYEMETKLSFNQDFGDSYKNLVKTLRNYDKKLAQIVNIPKVIEEDPNQQLKGPTPEQDLKLVRRNIYFLISLQNSDIASELLEFKIDKWVKEKFWEFADQFLRFYQRNLYEEKKTTEMEEVKLLIEQILAFVKLEAIPIVLGKTRFDSKLHIGRTYTRESSMDDGSIADVVKNGYKEINGVVLQQPEVIVNRL